VSSAMLTSGPVVGQLQTDSHITETLVTRLALLAAGTACGDRAQELVGQLSAKEALLRCPVPLYHPLDESSGRRCGLISPKRHPGTH
jgi:hypothetical protein